MIFEKILQQITGKTLMLEMSTLTAPTNQIPNYSMVDIIINPSSHLTTRGSRQEHNPPHFHIMAVGLDVSISLSNYDILALNTNKNKGIKFQGLTWDTSGQKALRKALMSWLDMNQNEQRIFRIWNDNNEPLQKAYFSFEQTKKVVVDFMSDEPIPSRVYLIKSMLAHNFINNETLIQVLDSIGVK